MTIAAAADPTMSPATVHRPPDHNRTGVNYRASMPRPKVRGVVIDAHCHLLAARHAKAWFEAADHFGIDRFLTMTPLEEALTVVRDYPGRLHFIAIPVWGPLGPNWVDEWLRHVEAFYNIGSRIAKFHMAPATMESRKISFRTAGIRRVLKEVVDRGMAVMSHVGDPDAWYCSKYTDCGRFGQRDEHYQLWEEALAEHRDHPWVGAHLAGNPENLTRLQSLLDRYPNLYLDCSATRWMVREVSARRDQAREFFVRNQDRILFGSDQVSFDDRDFDFFASRFWCHRKLWETAMIEPTPVYDPDVPDDQQPTLRGLALPDEVLQKLYHDNATKLLALVGGGF